MRVLVTMRTATAPDYHEPRDAISHDWIVALEELGLTPMLVPNATSDPTRYLDPFAPEALLLTSGDDVSTPFPPERVVDPPTMRDSTEWRLLRSCLDRGIPVLGVCRGLQVLNAHFGGRIARRLPSAHVATTHQIELCEAIGPLPAGTRVDVNSYHQHGILQEGLAQDLVPLAIAEDGSVEAARHRRLRVWGIQWHPERDGPLSTLDRAIIQLWSGR